MKDRLNRAQQLRGRADYLLEEAIRGRDVTKAAAMLFSQANNCGFAHCEITMYILGEALGKASAAGRLAARNTAMGVRKTGTDTDCSSGSTSASAGFASWPTRPEHDDD